MNQAGSEIGASITRPADHVLVWSDEFDLPGLPSRKWRFDTYRNRAGWYNDEQQYYASGRPKNSRVVDGNLVIEAHAERLSRRTARDWGGQAYTSARLISNGAWRYGYIEVRAKLPCARGSWPAIWMLPRDGGGRLGGEIDIMEHVGFEPGIVHHSLHTEARNAASGDHLTSTSRVPRACDDFHLYQLHWTRDAIVMGVDGVAAFRATRRQGATRSEWPFHTPFQLILNVAVGGSWGGAQGIDEAALPAAMLVDYVRVYQPAPDSQP